MLEEINDCSFWQSNEQHMKLEIHEAQRITVY